MMTRPVSLIRLFTALVMLTPYLAVAREASAGAVACPPRLPYSADKSYEKQWTVSGTNALYLSDILIEILDPKEEDAEGLDPVKTLRYIDPKTNRELEVTTYAIGEYRKFPLTVDCLYDGGITMLQRPLPPGLHECRVTRSARHSSWDEDHQIACD